MPRASHTPRKRGEIRERIIQTVQEVIDWEGEADRHDPDIAEDGNPTLWEAALEERDHRWRLLRDLVADLDEAEEAEEAEGQRTGKVVGDAARRERLRRHESPPARL